MESSSHYMEQQVVALLVFFAFNSNIIDYSNKRLEILVLTSKGAILFLSPLNTYIHSRSRFAILLAKSKGNTWIQQTKCSGQSIKIVSLNGNTLKLA